MCQSVSGRVFYQKENSTVSKVDIVMFYYKFAGWIGSLVMLFYSGVYSPCGVEIQQIKETKYG